MLDYEVEGILHATLFPRLMVKFGDLDFRIKLFWLGKLWGAIYF